MSQIFNPIHVVSQKNRTKTVEPTILNLYNIPFHSIKRPPILSFQITQNIVKGIIFKIFFFLHIPPQAHNSSFTEPAPTQLIPNKP